MKYLPTDVSSFTVMMTGNYTYVDKTQDIYNLFSGGTRYYFLSRPRRFGKSLLISTLHELFSGNKKLFENLWIGSSDYTWEQYPIIKIDFSTVGYRTPDEVDESLHLIFDDISKKHALEVPSTTIVKLKFKFLIERLSQKNKVVILIDEYDKPILDHINNVEMAEAIRERLREFYDTLKGLDDYLRAIFITGVTKFTKTSLFSGINHLNDISNTEPQATLLGYTQAELEANFQPYIKKIAIQQDKAYDETLKLLQSWYNGYRFSTNTTKVYNPFSILYCLKKRKFKCYFMESPGVALWKNYDEKLGYAGQSSVNSSKKLAAPGVDALDIEAPPREGEDWFESGTPTFLINILRKQPASIGGLTTSNISVGELSPFEISNIPLVPLLFQTGYITIKEYEAKNQRYRLGFPNHEVEFSFERFLVTVLTYQNQANVADYIFQMRDALDANDLDSFFEYLTILFAHIPYHLHIKQERYYHSLFQLICTMLGVDVQSEIATDKGRIDMVIMTKKYVYIFEFKFNESPQVALVQIEAKQYAQKYRTTKKQIIEVGVSFNRDEQELTFDYVAKLV